MIVFNHQLLFSDELTLQNRPESRNLEQIFIVEATDSKRLTSFKFRTIWLLASSRNVRYYSARPFEEGEKNFSWALEVEDVVILIWDEPSQKIFYIKGRDYLPRRLQFWVVHTFFPLVLELKQRYKILHVGAVEVNHKSILFAAPSFGGKSTLTHYFLQKGHKLLCDDTLAVKQKSEAYYAIASYPFCRPYRKLETLGEQVYHFVRTPQPIQALYLLHKESPLAKVTITELKGVEKFKAFHYSSFIDFPFMQQKQLRFFAQMATEIPVYQIGVPQDLKRLDEVYKVIISSV